MLSPNQEGYVDGNATIRLSFSELNVRANRLANALRSAKVQKGERIVDQELQPEIDRLVGQVSKWRDY